MKELLVISGKGGTGKTSIVGSFAMLATNKVIVDCDVDAANLYLLLDPKIKETGEYYGLKKAVIDRQRCTQCGRCVNLCRFEAIHEYQINGIFCEGCGLCVYVCPEKAIGLKENLSGYWFVSDTRFGPLVHAQLGIAEGNSGKLVSEVRGKAKVIATEQSKDYVLIDGPPGIGCPVISALTGVNLALIVTEPTMSGFHDLKRVVELVSHFKVPVMVCINKYDLDAKNCKEIEDYCHSKGIILAGKVPFDKEVTKAIAKGVPPVAYTGGSASQAINAVWDHVKNVLN